MCALQEGNRMKWALFVLFVFLIFGCGVDGAGFVQGEETETDAGVVSKGNGSSIGQEKVAQDATLVGGMGGTSTFVDAREVQQDGEPADVADVAEVEAVPSSVVPRRNGIVCERDEQCGTYAGSCINGRCTACTGEACGACASGKTKGLLCPVVGYTASACSFCEDDPRLWCDQTNPCPTGACRSPNCSPR